MILPVNLETKQFHPFINDAIVKKNIYYLTKKIKMSKIILLYIYLGTFACVI